MNSWNKRQPLGGTLLACAVNLALAQAALAANGGPEIYEFARAQRLSSWLAGQGNEDSAAYWAWFTPQERERALADWQAWREQIAGLWRVPPGAVDAPALANWLMAAQPQGRVPVGAAQVPWLQANPTRDPLLQPGDRLIRLGAEQPVGVLGANGVCWLAHRPQAFAQDYLNACNTDRAALLPGQRVWVIQPDGRVRALRLASWAPEHSSELAPGAIVWLGWPKQALLSDLSEAQRLTLAEQTAEWLARLWPWPQGRDLPLWRQAGWTGQSLSSEGARFDPQLSASNWGGVGLLQTPTARMRTAGSLSVSYHQTRPYSWLNVSMQPLDWLEAGFRYTSVSNRRYGEMAFSGSQSAKDKSFDVKIRLLSESDLLPQLAVGVRDLGGTFLFGSEYLVASKRWGRFDASVGLGWGLLGSRGTWSNPLAAWLGSQWQERSEPNGSVSQGGRVSGRLFHGRTGLFGGLEYQSAWGPVFKAEYDGNNYRHEPYANVLPQRSPINLGAVHRLTPGVDLSVGYERGNTWSLGLTLWTDLSRTHTTKLADAQPPALTPARRLPGHEPDWRRTRDDLQTLTDWRVERIVRADDRLVLEVSDSDAPYRQPRLDKALAVLHRDAPNDVQRLEVHHRQAGEVLAVQSQDRNGWLRRALQPQRTTDPQPQAQLAFVPAGEVLVQAPSLVEPQAELPRVWPSLSLVQSLGGPDAFMLYQLSAVLNGEWRLPAEVQMAGRVQARLLSNFDKFEFAGFSNLPRVRTHVREYLTNSRVTVSNLYLGKSARLATNWTASVYGGYLEEMFAGVGGELLYRQPGSPWAVGADMNQVRQRDFAQDFGLRDYRVKTGHLSLYWQTPWQNLDMKLQAGQYLAGDRGATLTVSRVFENGLRMGAFATHSNVSAQQFGEGSFNKGVFVSIPFDAILTRSSRATAQFNWVPLTRDGGAALLRPMRLIDDTSWLASPQQTYRPAPPPDDKVIPDLRQRP